MRKVTIADNLFMGHAKSAKVGGDNIGLGPSEFEWELADPREARFVTDSYIKDAPGPGQVAWLLEPFLLHPENYLEALRKPFHAVLSYNRYFCENGASWLWYAHGGSWLALDNWRIQEKSRQVSLVLSEKRSMPGHKLRHQLLDLLGGKLVVFGLDRPYTTLEAYGPYRYSIVIESERCGGYFSNRLIDCFATGTVPIYWGSPDIGNFFDERGIIQVECLADIQSCLPSMSSRDYARRRMAIRHNSHLGAEYRICEDGIYRNYPELFR